jgi:glycosyltransferase involved in cell wall biosynthesis
MFWKYLKRPEPAHRSDLKSEPIALKRYFFSFGVSDQFGWGIYGLNLVVEAYLQKLFVPIPTAGINFSIPLDPITHGIFKSLDPLWQSSPVMHTGDTVLVGLGNSGSRRHKTGGSIRQIGLTFFEHNPLPETEIKSLAEFDLVVAGSTWNLDKLREFGIKRSTLIVQGVNSDLFRPMPKRAMKDRFVVFSGGKLEFRKGQDLVVAAFSRFSKTHDDAILVASWNSPWSTQIAPSINHSKLTQPIQNSPDFASSVKGWVVQNGIDPDQFIDLGAVPNKFMPDVFREVDIAVFPNRCEGGTNLVAMEALSSGLTCIISSNTGHMDIIRNNNCLPLTMQREVPPFEDTPTRDWGESDVDEIVALLEKAYTSRSCVDPLNARASVAEFTWARSIKTLADCVEQATPNQ